MYIDLLCSTLKLATRKFHAQGGRFWTPAGTYLLGKVCAQGFLSSAQGAQGYFVDKKIFRARKNIVFSMIFLFPQDLPKRQQIA